MWLNESLLESPVVRFYKGRWQPELTRYWIIRDSELFKKISRLEAVGHIKLQEAKIKESKKLQTELLHLHRKDLAFRKQLTEAFFRSENAKKIPPHTAKYLKKILTDEHIGLGGIRNWQNHFHIKCLHLWTAYHLGNPEFENFIGAFVLENLE